MVRQNSCDALHAGPADELKPILKELADEGVFMRELDTGGQAFHSPMLAPTVDDLRAREHPNPSNI